MYFSRLRYGFVQFAMKHKRLLTSCSVLLAGAQIAPHNSEDMDLSKKYSDVGEARDCGEYYNEMAKDYDHVLAMWKYDMPQRVSEVISKFISNGDLHTIIAKGETLRVLDWGCGTGLVAVALKSALSNTLNFFITGVDISEEMLEQAKARNVYAELTKTDLNKNGLPFDENSFDVLTCVGTTTYLEPEITTREWLRVTKPGAVITFTHKTSVWSIWEKLQEQLVKEGEWELLWVSDELPYLQVETFKDERAKIYAYRKI